MQAVSLTQMITTSESFSKSSRVDPPWPLKQAFVLGCLGLATTFLVSLFVATSVPREMLSQQELVPVESILQCVVVTFAVWLYLIVIRKGKWREFWASIDWHIKSRSIAAWSGIGLLLSALIQHFTFGNPGINHTSPLGLTGKLIFFTFLATVLMQPLIEEIYFRGILFEALSSKVGWIWSISIVTIVFILSHVQHHWVLLPIGILLAIARISTRSTATCFALHASYNLGIIAWAFWPAIRT